MSPIEKMHREDLYEQCYAIPPLKPFICVDDRKTAQQVVETHKSHRSLEMENQELKYNLNMLKQDFDKLKEEYNTSSENMMPERYIVNEKATILFWKDGDKTIVKKCKDDNFNPRLGFLTAFFQKYCGMSKNKANKFLAKIEDDYFFEKSLKENKEIKDKKGEQK